MQARSQRTRISRLAAAAVARANELQGRLSALGVHHAQRDALDGFVRRALSQRGTLLTSLRALPVEELNTQLDTPAAAAAEVADPAAAAASAPRLYRHRAEIVLEGPAAQVAESIASLEAGLKP